MTPTANKVSELTVDEFKALLSQHEANVNEALTSFAHAMRRLAYDHTQLLAILGRTTLPVSFEDDPSIN
jgi:hypothetical protein